MSIPEYEVPPETETPAEDATDTAAYTRGLLAWLVSRAEVTPAERQQMRELLDQAYPPSQADKDAAQPKPGPQTTGATGDYFVPAGYQLVPTPEGGSQ